MTPNPAAKPTPLESDAIAATAIGTISDYKILEEIYRGGNTKIYRARHVKSGQAVILKLPQEERISREVLTRYTNELEIVRSIQSTRVVRCVALEQFANSAMLVWEDTGGRSLRQLLAAGRLSLPQALLYGAQIAAALNDVHTAHVIHKDINPGNIIVNPNSGELQLIDFGSSTMLTREQQSLVNPGVLVGTLAYVSPEQTGRMNRAIDYRSDFYSFGATLYEMLTGKPPFSADDPLDLVHLHIAKHPLPLHEVATDVPPVVSDIVLKLLAKTAEDRYQSAWGIKADLEECLRQWNETGAIQPFVLARQDTPQQFQIPQKLYGREKKIELLLEKFERAAVGGREILLIGGYSGIGKTSLIREVYKPITERHGYFISGKFTQFQRGTPYKALIAALRDLIKQLLTENEDRLGYWRHQLQQALESNGQLVIDVIPDVELIIGPQPPVAELEPVETQNRFNLVLRNFIQVFCRSDHPLAMFLDDLQWVDSASLKFLTYLLKDESLRYLLVIGAYRNNEVDQAHPLMINLQSLKTAGVAVDTMVLEPLKLDHVRQLIVEAFRCSSSEAQALAELIVNKTDGNPFFIEEFLKSLYAEGLLSFDPQQGRWGWSLDQIRARRITDNVVDLMTAKLERLPPDTRHVLARAACLGARFDLLTLTAIYQQSVEQTIQALRPALRGGLIDPVGSASSWLMTGSAVADSDAAKIECRFTHDRVQQAAYGLIPENEKPAVHKAVGRRLLADPRGDQDEKIFDIVNHLHNATALITEPGEREELAQLTLQAARLAKCSGAYDTAFNYLKTTLALWPHDGWQQDYALTFKLHAAAVDVAYLSGNFEDMETLSALALMYTNNVLDKIKIYETKAAAEASQGRPGVSIALGLEALKWLGLSLPAKPSTLRVWLSLMKLKLTLFGKSDDDLLNMSSAPHSFAHAKYRLLRKIGGAAYWTNFNLFAMTIFESLRLNISQGADQGSASLYASYGMILSGELGDIEAGYRYGELALRLINQRDVKQEKAPTHFVAHAMIRHWKRPAREVPPSMLETYQYALDAGNMATAAGSLLAYCYVSFHCGKELNALAEEFVKYNQIIKRNLQQIQAYSVNAIYQQATLNLLGKNSDPCSLSGELGDEEQALQKWLTRKQGTVLHTYYFIKQYLSYYFGHYAEAVEFSEKAKPYVRTIVGAYTVPVSVFYGALARLALYAGAGRTQRRKIWRQVARNRRQLQKWAQHAPANHLHKYLLVRAECERVRGNELAAINAYEQAIVHAKQNGYLQEQALANELAAKFHFARGRHSVGVTYLRQAWQCYRQWGALAKVEELQRAYPQLPLAREAAGASVSTSDGIAASHFDLHALMKALKGIAEERAHSQLIEKTILTAMEFAGADGGLLILRKTGDSLFVEAEIALDDKKPKILQSIPLAEATNVSHAIANYVKRTRKSVVINDALGAEETVPGLGQEPYIKTKHVKSVLCIPLLAKGATGNEDLIGLLYLENNQASGAFDEQRIGTLEIICLAAAGRLELSRKAMIDGLTDLYNHDTFQSLLQKEFSAAVRAKRPLSVVMIDIDHFKKFNDQWGHQVGDAVLRHVAAKLKDSTRQSDVVARYGGEEMAVILPDTEQALAVVVAERIRANIEAATVAHQESPLKVTASLGIATLSPNTKDAASLVKAADAALYLSKERGRNRVSVG